MSKQKRPSILSVASLRKVLHKKGFSAAQWREIGTQLELPSSELDEIEWAHPRSPRECLLKMLALWVRYDETGTMVKFKKALHECYGFSAAAARMPRYHRGGPSHITIIACFVMVAIGISVQHLLSSECGQPITNHAADWIQPNIPPPLNRYVENVISLYKNQPEVPGIEVLWYDKTAVKFIPPVFHKYDLRQHTHLDIEELYFDQLFRFTGLGQRILIQGRPGSGKTTLVNRLTKEWSGKTRTSKIAKCPLLLRVTLRELKMERPSGENLSLSDILSMNSNIKQVDEELEFLSEPKNAEYICIIFDGLDEYPPAYNDTSNYIYKIIDRRQLSPATVIVLSRPEAFKTFFQTSGISGFQAYELIGFNSEGITNYVSENIPDLRKRLKFLIYLQENSHILYQLCSSPLHLAMLVESYKHSNEFSSSLTEAYLTSLSKSIQREIARKHPTVVSCSVQLNDLSSLQKCNRNLFQTLVNISELAFNSFKPQSSLDIITFYGIEMKLAQTHFSSEYIRSYLPNGDKYGLLSPHYFTNEYGVLVTTFSFPHYVIQEFWAAFHVAVTRAKLWEIEDSLFLRSMFIYFVCGMHSSNTTVLHQVFEMLHKTLFWPTVLNDYIICGLESGYSSQSLVNTYLQLHGNVLNMDHLYPSRNVQSFINIIHYNITQIIFSQHCLLLRYYMEDRTMFPNLNNVTIRFITENFSGKFNYSLSYDFSDNLKLLFSRQRLRFLEWLLPLDALFDKQFLDLLGGIEIEEMNVTVSGSIVSKVPNNIYANCNTSVKLDPWPVMKLTPGILIAALTKFIDCFRRGKTQPGQFLSHQQQGLKQINIHFIAPVLLLDCQYVQLLFETFYKSSFYDITQHFDVMDTCRNHGSSVSHLRLPGYSGNIVLITLELGHLGINQSSRILYLLSGLVLEQSMDIYKAQVCTKDRQLYSYSRVLHRSFLAYPINYSLISYSSPTIEGKK